MRQLQKPQECGSTLLTTGFDKPALSPAEGLSTNGKTRGFRTIIPLALSQVEGPVEGFLKDFATVSVPEA